ncbi:MAG: hypothetical protein RPT11_09125 [Bermanella sp.]
MLAKFFSRKRLLLIMAIVLMPVFLSACGSSDDDDDKETVLTSSDASKLYISQNGAVTVSGVVVDAVKRTAISGVDVNIRIDGHIYSVVSAPASHASPGSFAFLLAPADSEFFLTVTTSDDSFATAYYADQTPRISNNSGGLGTLDVGSVELYKPVTTSITVRNIAAGSPITGLTLYYDTKVVAESNSGNSVSISGVDEVASEATTSTTVDGVTTTTSTGIYSFSLPDNGEDFNIKIKELIDGSAVLYEPYNATITDNVLTTLSAGGDKSYYVKASNPLEFTIFIHLVDDEGHAFDAGDAIVLNANGSTAAVFADRKADTSNVYVLTTRAATFDFTILNMDLNGDGINNTATAQLTTLDETTNVLDGGSFDANREATIVVPISMITRNQNIAAEMLSKADQFQVNGLAEVIIAFDRPVEIIHEVRMRTFTLNEQKVKKSVVVTANIFQKDGTTAAALTGDGALTVTLDSTDSSRYKYQNDANSGTEVTSLSDSSGEVDSPYEVKFASAESVTVIPSTSYAFSANNTLLTITLDSSTLAANQEYTFDLVVRGLLTDTPVAYISKTLTAKSNATIAALSDFWLDDFSFTDTTSRNLLDALAEQDLASQKDHVNLLSALGNVTYVGGGASDRPLVQYLLYGITAPLFGQVTAGIYLVSKAKISGTIEVISQTEIYQDAGNSITSSYNIFGQHYTLDYTSNSGIVAGDLDLSPLTDIKADAKYLLAVPSNHGIDEGGLKTVYGTVLEDTANEQNDSVSVVTSGAAISSEGIYYLYKIPLTTTLGGGGYISSAKLNLNVSVNGVTFSGEQDYTVQ